MFYLFDFDKWGTLLFYLFGFDKWGTLMFYLFDFDKWGTLMFYLFGFDKWGTLLWGTYPPKLCIGKCRNGHRYCTLHFIRNMSQLTFTQDILCVSFVLHCIRNMPERACVSHTRHLFREMPERALLDTWVCVTRNWRSQNWRGLRTDAHGIGANFGHALTELACTCD